MIKEEVIFEKESEIYTRRENSNQFILTDEQRNNINKRLPRGFSLVKAAQCPKSSNFRGEIEYLPLKREPRVASEDLKKQFLAQPIITMQPPLKDLGKSQVGVDKVGLRFSQLPEGKSKQSEKIKMILQRFRRHYRYPAFVQYLQRMGFLSSFQEIEAQNKKNIHTIDSFRDRVMLVFKHLKDITYEEVTLSMINELIDEFLFDVQQARKMQFESNLSNVQRSIDKVTRQISEIKECGNYYYRKKKRNQKNYEEKEILYIAELVRALPEKQCVGIIEVIDEKPFQEISNGLLAFNLSQLKPKKIREIEFYVKKKLSNHFKSRQRKRQKMLKTKKKLQKEEVINIPEDDAIQQHKMQRQQSKLLERQGVAMKQQAKNETEIRYIFQLDQQLIKNEEPVPQQGSFFSYDGRSRNELDDFLQDRPSDLFFAAEGERSIKNPSILDKNERSEEENVEFEQPNLVYNYQEQPRKQDYDSSDSSMITDEEDSDY